MSRGPVRSPMSLLWARRSSRCQCRWSFALTRQIGDPATSASRRSARSAVPRWGPKSAKPAPGAVASRHSAETTIQLGGQAAEGQAYPTLLPLAHLPGLRDAASDPRSGLPAQESAGGEAWSTPATATPPSTSRSAREHGLEPAELRICSPRSWGCSIEVAKLPYAVLIDGDGVIRAKGLVNTREHLESLFEAERLGVASLQEYLQRDEHTPSSSRQANGACRF